MLTLPNFIIELKKLAERIKEDFSSLVDANPEDQLKRPISDFLESIIKGDIATRTEVQVAGLAARPDIGVLNKGLLCGYIELKAPGISVHKFTGPNKIQFEKFTALPNLIYTNLTDWIHFNSGERIGRVVLSGEILTEGSATISDYDAANLYELFVKFLNWKPIAPRTPKALAEVLAPICRYLRSDVKYATLNDNSAIRFLYNDWQRLFFPDADVDRFADSYAQTITYALLLARLSGALDMTPELAATSLDNDHNLLAQTLRFLAKDEAKLEMETAIDLLCRVIQAVEPESLSKHGDPWLYFYEDFL